MSPSAQKRPICHHRPGILPGTLEISVVFEEVEICMLCGAKATNAMGDKVNQIASPNNQLPTQQSRTPQKP